MKYLKNFNESNETLIDKKIVYLNDITHDLRDSGYEVHIFNGSNIKNVYNSLNRPVYLRGELANDNGRYFTVDGKAQYPKFIYLVIVDKERGDIPNVYDYMKSLTPIVNNEIVSKLVKRIKSSNIGFYNMQYDISKLTDDRIIENYVLIRIQKYSKINRQELEDLIR